MNKSTISALMQAFVQLQRLADYLYTEAQSALESEDYVGASLLSGRAERIYEEAESIEILLSELEE